MFSPAQLSNAKLKLLQPHELVIHVMLKYGPGALEYTQKPAWRTWKWECEGTVDLTEH